MRVYMQPMIVHISNDFPDIASPDKTKAIQHLVDGVGGVRHIVYSLNRINGWKGIQSIPFETDRVCICYKALPKGFFWTSRLNEVADYIIDDLDHKGIIPDAIHGHKFTVEGLIAQKISQHFRKPFMLSIQGDTDTKILRMKPHLRKKFQSIAEEARIIFPFSLWPIPVFERYLILDHSKISVLPVVPGIDMIGACPAIEKPRFLTVFHLDSWKRKNIHAVLKALKILQKTIPDICLDIYGGGSVKSLKLIQKMINDACLENSVTLMGAIKNGSLPQIMKSYVGFLLPSKRETYGLVFAESLLSGLPILFPKGQSIDGFFPAEKIGYACNPLDIKDIVKGIQHLLIHQNELKSNIADLQSAEAFTPLRKNYILTSYSEGLYTVLTDS